MSPHCALPLPQQGPRTSTSRGYTSECSPCFAVAAGRQLSAADTQVTCGMCAGRHLMRFPDAAWDSIPDLPKNAINLLSETFTHSTSKVCCCKYSSSPISSRHDHQLVLQQCCFVSRWCRHSTRRMVRPRSCCCSCRMASRSSRSSCTMTPQVQLLKGWPATPSLVAPAAGCSLLRRFPFKATHWHRRYRPGAGRQRCRQLCDHWRQPGDAVRVLRSRLPDGLHILRDRHHGPEGDCAGILADGQWSSKSCPVPSTAWLFSQDVTDCRAT